MMPAGRPMTVAMNRAHSDSSTVAGNRLRNSWRIGCRVTIERPRSPCARSPRRTGTAARAADRSRTAPGAGRGARGQPPLADQQLDRIARNQPEQRERDDGHPKEGRDQNAQSRDQKTQHRLADPNDRAPASITATVRRPQVCWRRSFLVPDTPSPAADPFKSPCRARAAAVTG